MLTAAILAKNGMKVTVVEKNHSIGGGLHTFRRGGVDYATGMHVFGGFGEEGIMTRICKYLGIHDQVKVMETDASSGVLLLGGFTRGFCPETLKYCRDFTCTR